MPSQFESSTKGKIFFTSIYCEALIGPLFVTLVFLNYLADIMKLNTEGGAIADMVVVKIKF